MSAEKYRLLTETSEYRKNLGDIEKSVLQLLHYLPRGIGEYTSHGFYHSRRVIEYLNQMMEVCKSKNKLSDLEIFLLYASAWLHDIGCLLKREGHAKRSAEWIEQLHGIYIEGISDIVSFLQYIISGHSKDKEIEDVPEIHYFGGEKIRLRFLTALLRLADACDIDRQRAPPIVYEMIKDELDNVSVQYWLGHQNIDSVSFDTDEQVIIVGMQESAKSDKILQDLHEELSLINDILTENHFPFREFRTIIQKYEW